MVHSHHDFGQHLSRILLATAGAVLLGIGTAIPAAAHIEADATATAGGWSKVTFQVPTESDTASTTSITITMPADAQFFSVTTLAKPGWTVKLDEANLTTPATNDEGEQVTTYVKSITWTATGAGTKPDEFDIFAASIGPIPDVKTLAFPTLQGYSDGTTVDWNEIAEGTAEPEHPAPTIEVRPASGAGGHGVSVSPTVTATSAVDSQHQDTRTVKPVSRTDTLGIVGLGVGAIGVLLAAVALVHGSRRPTGQ
jgi:uncharacterized protein YcnI